ncbi:hypothetical protein [Bosea sp. MMO-172]|uniref:hypothetical protein n=1 Tax=Bosea sp. MMO-172 TaxID=3127885 RepID=UPI00301AE697
MATAQHYIICIRKDGSSWLLSLEPKTRVEADRSVSWQCQGGAKREEFCITTWDRETLRFVAPGKSFQPDEGPYTEAAWRDFHGGLAR